MRSVKFIGWFLAVGALLGHGTLSAQELPPQDGVGHGGFGGPVVKFTELDNTFAVLVGGRGGWIINESFVLGGGGYGLVNQQSFENVPSASGNPGRLTMGYGGLEFEYVHRPAETVHLSLAVLLGGGALMWDPQGQVGSGNRQHDTFFVSEPALNVLFNVTRHFRAGLGVSYRFMQGVELVGLSDRDVSGLTGVVTLKFGRF